MIRLFIENNEIELTDDVQVAITSQFEDLSNPTTIINNWSKTVSIPFTANNNKIFGHIYNPDKVIVDGGTVGIYFNPLLKLDFRLEWDSTVIMIGYAKLNEVKQNNGKGTYELTLFGELGKVFQEMKKITFDTSTDDTDYLIDGSEYVDEHINKELVAQSWSYGNQIMSDLIKKGEPNYYVTDIIGFAPNNAFSDEFDYKSFQTDGINSKTFSDVLDSINFSKTSGIEASSVIPDGMFPREIGEYRSYLQLPWIYWNKLFNIFKEKAEDVTGYQFELDDTWFNNSNPYWHDLVYMLKSLDVNKGDMAENSYYLNRLSTAWNTYQENYDRLNRFTLNVNSINYENKPLYVSGNTFNLIEGVNYTSFKFNYKLDLITHLAHRTQLKSDNALLVHIVATGSNGTVKKAKYLFTDDITRTFSGTSDYTYIKLDTATQEVSGHDILRAYFTGYHTLRYEEMGDTVSFSLEYKWYKNSYPYSNSYDVQGISLDMLTTNTDVVITENSFRTNGRFILNDLWNKDYNVFDAIIRYCKMFRIGISVDEFNKKVIFKPYTEYFKDYTVVDWTDKVDKSMDFTIKPITFEDKYILFNYEDSETQTGKEYKDKYGVNYGDYRLVTDYNFNNETKELFEKVTPSITNTDNVLSWDNLYNNKNIVYSFPAEIFVYNKDNDGKQVDLFGAFFFHNGLATFSTEEALNLRNVYISDDTDFQIANSTYFYVQRSSDMERVITYPLLDVVRNNNLCLFNIPKENYTYLNNYSGAGSIYTNLWENYINERYDIQNKKITCYVTLKPHEYSQFAWNKLVTIGNQLCIVNKIYDYDVTSNAPTKVDLITVQNIHGYTDNTYAYDYVIASKHQLTIPYDYYKKVTITSNGNWEIRTGDWTDFLTAYPASGTSGETVVFIGSIDENVGGTLYFDLLNEEGTEVIGSDSVICNVGGTSTISVSQWYNEILKRGSTTVTVTSSSAWSVVGKDTSANGVSVTTSGSTGETICFIRSSIRGTTGVNDYYLENENGDIVSFRVNVIE